MFFCVESTSKLAVHGVAGSPFTLNTAPSGISGLSKPEQKLAPVGHAGSAGPGCSDVVESLVGRLLTDGPEVLDVPTGADDDGSLGVEDVELELADCEVLDTGELVAPVAPVEPGAPVAPVLPADGATGELEPAGPVVGDDDVWAGLEGTPELVGDVVPDGWGAQDSPSHEVESPHPDAAPAAGRRNESE